MKTTEQLDEEFHTLTLLLLGASDDARNLGKEESRKKFEKPIQERMEKFISEFMGLSPDDRVRYILHKKFRIDAQEFVFKAMCAEVKDLNLN